MEVKMNNSAVTDLNNIYCSTYATLIVVVAGQGRDYVGLGLGVNLKLTGFFFGLYPYCTLLYAYGRFNIVRSLYVGRKNERQSEGNQEGTHIYKDINNF